MAGDKQMITMLQKTRLLLFVCVSAITGLSMLGCKLFPESTFQLATDSRLPKWITLPPETTRANVSLTMSYYIKPWGGSAQFTLQDANKRLIEKINGKTGCQDPFHLKGSTQGSAGDYPTYEAVTVKGITELIEHRKMEPIFYVTDSAVVWRQYRATGCN
jgi:hypothetical protein